MAAFGLQNVSLDHFNCLLHDLLVIKLDSNGFLLGSLLYMPYLFKKNRHTSYTDGNTPFCIVGSYHEPLEQP